ncbi:MAG: hypothetical protein L0Y58_21580 [Verrucomicrobia subdivision 3 bacterium]|nr:hypothetical protein [Limisphaerales bacterium]
MKGVVLPLAGILGTGLLLVNAGAAHVEVIWRQTNNFHVVDFGGLNTPIVKVHRSGDIYLGAVAGIVEGTHVRYDYVVVRRDGDGRLIWQTRVPTAEQAAISAFALDDFGNAYVTGSGGTAKLNANGSLAWAIPFGDPESGWKGFSDVGVDSQGNVYVTGHSLVDPNSLSQVAITTIKYSATGDRLWVRQYLGGLIYWDPSRQHLRVDESGNVYVAGDVRPHPALDEEWAIIKYDGNGRDIWTRRYDGPGLDQVGDVALDRAGNLLVTGYDGGHVTVKYDPDGNLLWEAHQAVDGDTIALDHSGNVYVRAWYSDEETTFHALLKFDSDGRHQWTVALTSDFTWSRAFAVDKKGNAYLGVGFAVLKYDRRGNLLTTIPFPNEVRTMDADRAGRLLVSTPLETLKIVTR